MQKYVFSLGSLWGIPVRIHLWFPLAGLAALGFLRGLGLSTALVTLFGAGASLLLHELAHAYCAQKRGYRVRAVTLHPLRSAVALDGRFRPADELPAALAGPAATLGTLLLASLGNSLSPSLFHPLVLFNAGFLAISLLPILPQDGGLALRAALTPKLGERRAIEAVGKLGFFMGLALFGLAFLRETPWLAVASLWVWSRTLTSVRGELAKQALRTATVGQAMLRQFQTLGPADRLGEVAQALIASGQHDFPVVQGETVLGIFHAGALLQGLTPAQAKTYVAGQMRRELDWAEADELLGDALNRVREGAKLPLLVRHDGHLVGLLTVRSFNEFTTLQVNAPEQAPSEAADRTSPRPRS